MNIQNRLDEIHAAKRHHAELVSSFKADVQVMLAGLQDTPPSPVKVPRVADPIAHAKRHGFRVISKGTKKAVIKDIKAGMKPSAVARKHGINVSTVYAWQKAL